MQIRSAISSPAKISVVSHASKQSDVPTDSFSPAQETPGIYGPQSFKKSEVRRAVERMVRSSVTSEQVAQMSRTLEPYGEKILNRLADNGLTVVVPEDGYAHYSTEKKRITFPAKDLAQDQEGVPFRDYMILHEMAHAMDFLLEPDKGPLSERADLGIDRHRGKLNALYRPVLQRFEEIKSQRQRQGTWGPRPGMPTARVYGEDYMTVVEKVTGRTLSERPARGHITILEPSTRPTEYFADAVYTYLHSEPVSVHRYTLPDGQPIAHSYPPTRAAMEQKHPNMFEAVDRFFQDPDHAADSLRVPTS